MVLASNLRSPAGRIALRVPVIVLVLAAIAIPVELRPPGRALLDHSVEAYDVIENIAGFVPVGIVLGELGLVRAIISAALISTFAESSQFFMVHRDPSAVDIASNVLGAILGALISTYWKIRSPQFRISRWKALGATALALVIVLGMWSTSGDALSTRGATSPGTLEANWKFEESRGRAALDSSGYGRHGRFQDEPKYIPGVIGDAVKLDDAKDYIYIANSTPFRLTGSMTISAWINSRSFPVSDAAVVSQVQGGLGYQLDTTVDRGVRTICFRLTNSCEDAMARYGATSLVLDTWYHVAGVYDAQAQTIDVYLNGELDNGFLLGLVSGTQRSSRSPVCLGRPCHLDGFEFTGSIDEARIYSFALTKTEVAADMHGKAVAGRTSNRDAGQGISSSLSAAHPKGLDAPCAVVSERQDARIPGLVAVFGALVAIAYLGFNASGGLLRFLAINFAAGLLLVPATPPALPSWSRWMMSLVSLAGGASIAFSIRRQNEADHRPCSRHPG